MKTASYVKETTTSTGQENITLAGAVAGYRTFSAAFAVGDWVGYYIVSDDGTEWERGVAQLTAATTLGRSFSSFPDNVFESSSGTSLVDFSAGTKTVAVYAQPPMINDDRGLRLLGSFGASVFSITSGNLASAVWSSRQHSTETPGMYPTLQAAGMTFPEWADVVQVNFRERFRIAQANPVPAGMIYSQLWGSNINLNGSQYFGSSPFSTVASGGYWVAETSGSVLLRRTAASATLNLRHYNYTDQTVQRYEGWMELTILG